MGPALELLWGNVGAGALQWRAEGWGGSEAGSDGVSQMAGEGEQHLG